MFLLVDPIFHCKIAYFERFYGKNQEKTLVTFFINAIK